jgi:hypothetical protein
MDCCLSFGGSDHPFMIVNFNWGWFRFFAVDNVVCVHRLEYKGYSLFRCFDVQLGA